MNKQKLNLLNEIESMRLIHSKFIAENDIQLASNADAYNNIKRDNELKAEKIQELNNLNNSLITDLNRIQNEFSKEMKDAKNTEQQLNMNIDELRINIDLKTNELNKQKADFDNTINLLNTDISLKNKKVIDLETKIIENDK